MSLLATCGKLTRRRAYVKNLIVSARREHSRKPDETYNRIKDTLKKAENATVWIVKPLILRDSESAAPNFSVFP
jgi:hypothetical protein